jgi:hypothetical protein
MVSSSVIKEVPSHLPRVCNVKMITVLGRWKLGSWLTRNPASPNSIPTLESTGRGEFIQGRTDGYFNLTLIIINHCAIERIIIATTNFTVKTFPPK